MTNRHRTALALAAIAMIATACSAERDDSSATEPQTVAHDAPAAVGDDAATGAAEGMATGGGVPGIDLGSIGRDVVVEMHVTMESDDIRATVEGIMRDAVAAGGGVAQTDVDYGDDDPDGRQGRARLVVKVPPTSIDQMMSGLDRLGRVTSIGQDAQDVTEQLIDLDVQIANAQRSVARVRELLDEATDLRTIVEIEADLTERQIRLERLLATERALEERVTFATLTIDVVATAAAGADDAVVDDGIGDAFSTGWEAFVAVLFGIGFVLAVLSPFLAVAAVVVLAVWLLVRSRRRGDTSDEAVSAAAPERQRHDDDLVSATPPE